MRVGLRVAAMVVVLLASGCPSGPGGPAAAKVSDFCGQLVDTYVSRAQACLGGSQEAWTKAIGGFKSNCASYEKSVSANRLKYDQGSATLCLEAMRNAGCESIFSDGDPSSDPNGPCKKAMAGQVAAGGGCYDDFECSGDSSCDRNNRACPGACKARAAANAACTSDENCSFGASCVGSTAARTCLSDAAENQPCGGSRGTACKPGLFCQGGSGTAEGSCKPVLTTGACTGWDGCAAKTYCAGYNSSTNTPGTCTASKAVGAACTGGQGGGIGGECEPFTACIGGKCTAYPGVGAQCGDLSNTYVGCADSWCDAPSTGGPGTCKAYKAVGESCNPQGSGDFFGGGECGSGECDSSTSKCVAQCVARQ